MLFGWLIGATAAALEIEYAVMAPEMSWYRAAKACASNGWRLARVNEHNIGRVEEVLHQSGYASGWVGSWDGRGRLSKNSAFLFRTGRQACCEIDTVSIIPKCSLKRCVKKRVAICEIKCKSCPKKLSSSSSSTSSSSSGKKHHKRGYDSASISESISINKASKFNRNEPVVVYSSITPTHNILVNRSKHNFSLNNSLEARRHRLVIIKVKCPKCKQRLHKRAYGNPQARTKPRYPVQSEPRPEYQPAKEVSKETDVSSSSSSSDSSSAVTPEKRFQKRGYSHKTPQARTKPRHPVQSHARPEYWPAKGPFSNSSSSSAVKPPKKKHRRHAKKVRKSAIPAAPPAAPAAASDDDLLSVDVEASVDLSVGRSRERFLVHYSESTVEEIEPAPNKCHHKPLVPRAIRHHRKFNKRLNSRHRKLSVSASVSASVSVSV